MASCEMAVNDSFWPCITGRGAFGGEVREIVRKAEQVVEDRLVIRLAAGRQEFDEFEHSLAKGYEQRAIQMAGSFEPSSLAGQSLDRTIGRHPEMCSQWCSARIDRQFGVLAVSITTLACVDRQ